MGPISGEFLFTAYRTVEEVWGTCLVGKQGFCLGGCGGYA